MTIELPPEAVDAPTPVRPPGPSPSGDKPPSALRVRWLGTRFAVAAATLAVVWALRGTGVGIGSLISGRQGGFRLLEGLVPPDTDPELLGQVVRAVTETLQISLAALFFGALLGLPLAVAMAGNVGAPRWCARAARTVAAGFRSVPELLWAVLFVAMVGLGPAAGVYAISLHAAGLLAKLGSEQLEAVDPAPVEAVRLTGAGAMTTTVLAIVPQARNGLASLLLYQWECNIRSSAVVGFVGAGGVGQALGIALRLFRYGELATLLIAVLLLIILVDQLSRVVRRAMGAGS